MKYFFLLLAIFLLTIPAAAYAKITNTNELIAAMQKKYGDRKSTRLNSSH